MPGPSLSVWRADSTQPLAYFPWEGTSEVRVYNMNTFQEVTSYDFQDTFNFTGSHSFVQGRTRISRDGLMFMVSVTGGVRFLKLLTTSPVSASSSGGRIQVTLPATNSPVRAAYGLASQPPTARPSCNGNQLTYVPDPGFTGTDTFSYAAEYHHVTATAPVTINVTADTSPYNPTVSFGTLPVLQASTPVPGSARVPGDFNGDGTWDVLWFNPGTSQLGYWSMTTNASGAVKRTGAHVYDITPGYFIGAAGDLDGDGYTDLVFTSANHDLWLWTNTRSGSFPLLADLQLPRRLAIDRRRRHRRRRQGRPAMAQPLHLPVRLLADGRWQAHRFARGLGGLRLLPDQHRLRHTEQAPEHPVDQCRR